MDFGFTKEEDAFRQEIRDYLSQELPAEPVGRTPEEMFSREFSRKLAAKGWLGIGWPTEYGGLGRSFTEQLICSEEMMRARAPGGAHVLAQNMVGPALIRVGTDEQKREFLPKILSGDLVFCLGYTEPNAGTDLANCQTTALLDGDEYVINGQKMFTSYSTVADYAWMTVRTDPDAPRKHRGISMFIVDMKTPGITVGSFDTMWDFPVHEVFFDNVRVPKTAVVGELNKGWDYLTVALDHERVFMGGTVASHSRLYDDIVEYAKKTYRNGRLLSDDPIIRQRLAQLAIDLQIARLFAHRVAWILGQGIVPFAEASMTKIFTSELEQRVANTAMLILGPYGPLDEPQFPFKGYVGWEYKFSLMQAVGGGSNEIERILIAIAGLGLPRP